MPMKRAAGASSFQGGYVAKDLFTYSIRFQNLLSGGGTAQGQFAIDTQCDFMWQKATFWLFNSTDNEVDIGFGDILFTITESGTGRKITNIPTPLVSVFGSANYPFVLPTAKLFRARSSITMTLTNNSTNIDYSNVYCNFIGTQLFLARAK